MQFQKHNFTIKYISGTILVNKQKVKSFPSHSLLCAHHNNLKFVKQTLFKSFVYKSTPLLFTKNTFSKLIMTSS